MFEVDIEKDNPSSLLYYTYPSGRKSRSRRYETKNWTKWTGTMGEGGSK